MINYYYNNEEKLRPYTHTLQANEGTQSPINALRIEPEFKEGFWPCENDGVWVQVEDHREALSFLKSDPTTVQQVDYIGAIDDEYTLLEPLTIYHSWNGKKWTLTTDGKEQQSADERIVLEGEAKQLMIEAGSTIEILQDRIELEDYDSQEELDQISNDLKTWKKYRIALSKFIKGLIEDLPERVTPDL